MATFTLPPAQQAIQAKKASIAAKAAEAFLLFTATPPKDLLEVLTTRKDNGR